MTKDDFFAEKEAIVPNAKYVQFKQDYKSDAKDVYIFTEDDDDFEFYRTLINHVYLEYKTFKYSMKGKQNVKNLYNLIEWSRYNKSRLLFFVDKDYDDLLNIEQIDESNFFYTTHYSIENYLVTDEVFCIILDRYFVNEVSKELREKLLDLYRDAYSKFVIKLRTLTWFILIDRDKSKKLVLDDFKLTFLIHFEKMQFFEKKLVPGKHYDNIMRSHDKEKKSIVRNKTLKEILVEKCGGNSDDFNFENIMQKRDLIFSMTNHKKFIRGKYDLWFLLEILKTVDKTIDSIYKSEGIIVNNENPIPRRKIEITNQNIFDLVCPKMPHPVDVKNFLVNNYRILNGNN